MPTSVILEIDEERGRQVAKGYDASHDDRHDGREIAWAAACYAAPERLYRQDDRANGISFIDPWPWRIEEDARPYNGNRLRDPILYGTNTRRRLLIKAAALLVAEIERMDRSTKPPAHAPAEPHQEPTK